MPHLFHVTLASVADIRVPKERKALSFKSLHFAVRRKRRDRRFYPQYGYFSKHLDAVMSPNGYEDDYINIGHAAAPNDFMNHSDRPTTDFIIDTSTESGNWTPILKETLKKYLFLFGFDRLEKIRRVSDALSR